MAQNDIGIDLGTTTIIIAQEGKGVEVKIPTELLNAESEVEFLHADDGSISLLIKNVIL